MLRGSAVYCGAVVSCKLCRRRNSNVIELGSHRPSVGSRTDAPVEEGRNKALTSRFLYRPGAGSMTDALVEEGRNKAPTSIFFVPTRRGVYDRRTGGRGAQ